MRSDWEKLKDAAAREVERGKAEKDAYGGGAKWNFVSEERRKHHAAKQHLGRPAGSMEPLFHLLNPRDPVKARRRLAKLYWVAWKPTVIGLTLTFFGLAFLTVAGACWQVCDETERAYAFLFIGVLLTVPGIYSVIVLTNYVRCLRGFTYKHLPGMED